MKGLDLHPKLEVPRLTGLLIASRNIYISARDIAPPVDVLHEHT
jgi:hypothetical protein